MLIVIFAVIFNVLIGLSGWRVYSRAGFAGYWGLAFLFPVLNILALLYLAQTDWPVAEKQGIRHTEKR